MPRHWAMSLCGAFPAWRCLGRAFAAWHDELVTRTVDFTALTSPVTRHEVAGFRSAMRKLPQYSTSATTLTIVIFVIVAVFLLLSGIGFAGFFLLIAGSIPTGSGIDIPPLTLAVPVVLLALVVLVIVLGVRGVFGSSRWERWFRLSRFAESNDLVFSPADSNPSYPGMIFSVGHTRSAIDHLRPARGRFFDYGNFRSVTGSGDNRSTRVNGFLALSLDRSLPHMVLDSRSNNSLFGSSNLPGTFSRDQVLKLEGDFGKYFTLYCPSRYERDALYVFTPDLMALLIDEAAPFDVEIIDRWMFVYSAHALDMRQPAVHQRLLRIVDTVGAKALTQTERYADERVASFAANIVAPPGQRLRRGWRVGTVITVAIVLAFFVLQMFGVVDGLFGGLVRGLVDGVLGR